MRLIFLMLLNFFLAGCASHPKTRDIVSAYTPCTQQFGMIQEKSIEFQINSLTTLFERQCFAEVIELGQVIRKKNRDKYYSVSKELAEVVVYEGVAKEYVLDAHERTFLSLLLTLSYLGLNKPEEAKVELRKTYNESVANIYNSGTDQVNVLLQGILWLRLNGIDSAEPFFKAIADSATYDEHLKLFTAKLAADARKQKRPTPIAVTGLNRLPEIQFDWFSTYSLTYSPEPKVKNCISDNGLLITTRTWTDQIQNRDRKEQDPILNYKRALRFPAAILYSSAVLAIGGGLTYISALHDTDGRLTALLGLTTLYLTERTFVNSLAPDMRYWYELPEAIFVNTSPKNIADPCLRRYPNYKTIQLIKRAS